MFDTFSKNKNDYLNALLQSINKKTNQLFTEVEALEYYQKRVKRPNCKEHWIESLDCTVEEAVTKVSEYQSSISKRRKDFTRKGPSPMSPKFWMQKINPETGINYTHDEAMSHIRSFRKNSLEYWTSRGYSVEEAKALRSEFQNVGFESRRKFEQENPDVARTRRRMCKEFWTTRGYSEEEAAEKVRERQRTFTLEKCILKYGEQEGVRRWQERQDKWLKSFNDKTPEELADINYRKSEYNRLLDPSNIRNEEFFNQWRAFCAKHGMLYCDDIQELKDIAIIEFNDMISCVEDPIGYYYNEVCRPYLFKALNISCDKLREWLKPYEHDKIHSTSVPSGKYRSHRLRTEAGDLLRSSKEIKFYRLCKLHGITPEVAVRYPESRMMCDFRVGDLYIEIAGLMSDPDYRERIIYKHERYNSYILDDEKLYEDFIIKVLVQKDEESIGYYFNRPL